eukprot:TRINITY_DN64391_c0_g1_i1.p1 TRINITY_DN64391_c0_g1~~TRINITY_DN64391_c0_g1_i1.p1  ORF type:complete len:416 (-),score=54.54 TRINITY_DN64391_c0_g1_i1:135-1382(-)
MGVHKDPKLSPQAENSEDVTSNTSDDKQKLQQANTPTLAEIRAAIPKECFQHSTIRALSLVFRDGLVIASLFYLATRVLRTPGVSEESLTLFDWVGWALYSFLQGTAFIGWWVLAHECGHGGFSSNKQLNDCVGWVLHSFLLVPYFSWQYSHAKHHSNTNHLVNGESHVPETRADLKKIGAVWVHDVLGEDCFAVLELLGHLLVGWPLYLFFNLTGGRRLKGAELQKPVPFPEVVDHFRPWSPLFPESWRVRIALSTLGVILTLGGLALACKTFGSAAVAVHYVGPYLWANAWLVLYTWLQHTDPSVPHYGDEDFTWLKGALCTIDRPYGVFDWMHHHIGSTHVCHHIFSHLPCYHAVEATKHLKAFLEPYGLYRYDATPWPLAAWKVAKTCHCVDDVHGTQYPKPLHGEKSKGE